MKIITLAPKAAPAPGAHQESASLAPPGGDATDRAPAKARRSSRRRTLGLRTPRFMPMRKPEHDPVFEVSTAVKLVGSIPALPAPVIRPWVQRPEWWACVVVFCLGVPLLAFSFTGIRPVEVMSPDQSAGYKEPELNWLMTMSSAGNRAEADALLQRFFAAATPEEKAPLVRGGAEMLPVMRAWYARHPDEAPAPVISGVRKTSVREGVPFIRGRGEEQSGRQFEYLLAKSGDGYLLDWRAFVGCGAMEWGDFLKQRPESPVDLRLCAVRDDFKGGPFEGRDDMICLRVRDGADTATAFAWAARGTPAGDEIERRLPVVGADGNLRMDVAFAPGQNGKGLPHLIVRTVYPHDWMDTDLQSAEPAAAVR